MRDPGRRGASSSSQLEGREHVAPAPALGRPAAAGRARAGAGQPARGAAARRAAGRARPEAAHRHAERSSRISSATSASRSCYVTHDQGEAFSMSDRVAVMNPACSSRWARPRTSTTGPRRLFVADFVGTANRFAGRVAARGRALRGRDRRRRRARRARPGRAGGRRPRCSSSSDPRTCASASRRRRQRTWPPASSTPRSSAPSARCGSTHPGSASSRRRRAGGAGAGARVAGGVVLVGRGCLADPGGGGRGGGERGEGGGRGRGVAPPLRCGYGQDARPGWESGPDCAAAVVVGAVLGYRKGHRTFSLLIGEACGIALVILGATVATNAPLHATVAPRMTSAIRRPPR